MLELEGIKEGWRTKLNESLKKMRPDKFEMFARDLIKQMRIELDKKIGIQTTA